VLPLAPFFLVAAAAGLVTAWVERTISAQRAASSSFHLYSDFSWPAAPFGFTSANSSGPSNLVLLYPRWAIDPGDWRQWVFPIAAITTTIALWAIRKLSRAPLAAWLYFVGTLLPVLGFSTCISLCIRCSRSTFSTLPA